MITIGWLVVLLLGLVAIYKANKANEYVNGGTMWFLTAFWAYLVFSPFVAFGVHVLAAS